MDIDRLVSTKPEQRTSEVKAKELQDWPGIDKGKTPVFKVRQLTLAEFDMVREAPQQEKLAAALIEKLSNITGTAEAVAEAAIGDPEMPEATKRKARMVELGSVEPKLDRRAVTWLFTYHPMVGERLFLEISKLTGEGAAPPGKQLRSGTTRKSKQPLPSET